MKCNKDTIIYTLVIINVLVTIFLVQKVILPTETDLRNSYYKSEVATLVSPHSLRELIHHGENPYVLVDVREYEDYLRGHIVGSINIVPGDGMVKSFKELQETYKGKEILIYCYTQVCLRGRKVGKELIKNGISVKELGIGYNEWEFFWKEWNYDNEWASINIRDYIRRGKEPGFYKVDFNPLKPSTCAADQKFGC